ncbi:MAG TPA: hypothetical protein VFH74_16580 [Gaiellales bacterium]|nr:hypothetical protein [Gaiellales bacterium]
MRRGVRGHLCPVCVRPVREGTCSQHGPWKPHQLLSHGDRRRAERERWQPFEPLGHACPRCLGEVADTRGRFGCLDHGHDHDQHGPFRVDELLLPSAQRESAMARHRLARRSQARRREPAPLSAISVRLPDPGRSARVVISASIVAGTLAFLAR